MRPTALDTPADARAGWPRVAVAKAQWALPVGLPSLAAFVITIWNVARPSMYGTEAVTTWAAHLPLPSLVHVLTHVDAVHGAYYLVMHVVFLLGSGTFWLRVPSVLGMTAAAGLTAQLARRLTGSSSAALFAGLAMAIAPLTTEYGQAGRSYAIDTAAAVLTWSLFLTAVQDEPDSRRAWWRFTIAVALTAYLHEMTLLVLGANAVTLAWARCPRATWRRWLRASGRGLLLAIPVLVASYVQDHQVSWIKPATLATAQSLYRMFLGPGDVALALNLVLIGVCVLVALVVERHSTRITLTRLALPNFVVAPMLLIGESMVATPLFGGVRYVIWALPAMALLVGHGLDLAVRGLFRGRALVVGVVVGLAVLLASLSTQWSLQRQIHTAAGSPQDLLAGAEFLHEHAHVGDGVIYAPRNFYSLELGYPQDLTALRDLVLGQSGRAGGRLYGTELGRTGITEAVDSAHRIWYVGTGTPYHSTRPELVALRKGFRRVSTFAVKGFKISLWERRAGRPR